MRAFAVGYGPFGNSSSGVLPALVSTGVISKVLSRRSDRFPLFVQSCTTVHRGTSGGPLLDEYVSGSGVKCFWFRLAKWRE
jgi:Trypsin-like peptidase domain